MSQPPSPDNNKGTILVIDDTPANLRLLSKMLTLQGYDTRVMPNGVLALQTIRIDPPDLILLDINMPGLDGYEVCQRLKSDEDTQDIPIIFISALDEVLDKVKAFEVGGVDYVTKPFQTEEVIARVETHLALQALQKQAQQAYLELFMAQAAFKEGHQALLDKTSLDDLFEALMTIVVETSAASRGLLIFDKRIGRKTDHPLWAVETEIIMKDNGTVETNGQTPQNRGHFPQKLITQVAESQILAVINDLKTIPPSLGQDQYLISQKPQSLLCMPLLHQTKLVGLLYLEHNQANFMFTSDEVNLLQLLAGQLAASIRNARLYANVKRNEHKYRTLMEGALDAVIEMDVNGFVIGWNRQAEITFGWCATEAIGEVLSTLIIPPDLRERHEAGLRRYLETKEGSFINRRAETTGQRRDGSTSP
ncbi:MAG: response regulator, partial [Chloroflexota bacterium]